MMASEREIVIAQVTAYVNRVHGGDWAKAFDAAAKDGQIGSTELEGILARAGVGSFDAVRRVIVRKIMAVVDKDGDGKIGWEEFQAAFNATKG